MKDIAFLLRRIDEQPGMSDAEILEKSANLFRYLCFSEVIRGMSSVLEQEDEEIVQIYTSVLMKTLLNTESQRRAILCSLILVIRCFEETAKRKLLLPASIEEIDALTSMACSMAIESPLICSIIKELVKRIYPSVRTTPFYVDLTGFMSLRDNMKNETARTLSQGAETTRTVQVASVGDDDVGLLHEEQVIFQLRAQTMQNSEFSRACAAVLDELKDIIPPPIRSEPEIELLDVLPAKQIKALLKTGRIAPSKRTKEAELPSLPPIN